MKKLLNFYLFREKVNNFGSKFLFEKKTNSPNSVNQNLQLIEEFVEFCKKELSVERKIKILLTDIKARTKTFAHFSLVDNSLTIYVKNRHIGDILRSIAHELKHLQQKLNGELMDGSDGSKQENEANSFAGIMIRKFGRQNPSIYENYINKKNG